MDNPKRQKNTIVEVGKASSWAWASQNSGYWEDIFQMGRALPEFARCGVLSQWGLELIKIRNVSCLHISEYGNNEGLSIRLRGKVL